MAKHSFRWHRSDVLVLKYHGKSIFITFFTKFLLTRSWICANCVFQSQEQLHKNHLCYWYCTMSNISFQIPKLFRFDSFEEKVFGIRAGKGCSSSFHSDLGDLLKFLQVIFCSCLMWSRPFLDNAGPLESW